MEKLDIGKYCNPNSCQVKYKVVIHQQSNKSVVSDLMLKPMVYIGLREEKRALIEKTNLNLISTKEDPCSSDNTWIGLDYQFKLVCIPKYSTTY